MPLFIYPDPEEGFHSPLQLLVEFANPLRQPSELKCESHTSRHVPSGNDVYGSRHPLIYKSPSEKLSG